MTEPLNDLKPILAKVGGGAQLSASEAEAAFEIIMSGSATPSQIGGFLMALRVRGETVTEITAAAKTMRAKALHIPAPDGAMDCCGTGGDASGTYNISTAVSFILAAAGVPVAKHGNRALSSKAGAADVLSALKVDVDVDMERVKQALWEVGVTFLFAVRHHGAMRHVGPTRVELGTRTIFNLLGPLSNPALAKRQLLGVFDGQWVLPMAETLKQLGSEKVWVVHGADGLDEITTTGETKVAALEEGRIREFTITPEDVGLPYATLDDLKGGDAEHNAAALHAVLAGETGPYRDIVLFNAAAALLVGGKADDLIGGMDLAKTIIADGAATAKLEQLIAFTSS